MTKPTSGTTPPIWEQPGYSDIDAAVLTDAGRVAVTFANSDTVIVDVSDFGTASEATAVEAGPDRLSVRIDTAAGSREVSWEQLRVATDPTFADELRRRDLDEAKRIGVRLRALREDRGVPQGQLAARTGMTPPQLSKIESGAFDLRMSTVRSLLRALDATWADIGPDAPEYSAKSLRRKAVGAGLPAALFDRLAAGAGREGLAAAIGRAFNWSTAQLMSGQASSAVPVGVAFKSARPAAALESPLLTLSYTLSQIVVGSGVFDGTAEGAGAAGAVPADPGELRRQLLPAPVAGGQGSLSVRVLAEWAWGAGVAVLPLTGGGVFTAAALRIDGAPVVVVKETREFEAFWLFDLAHELGHVALGHTGNKSVVDVDSPTARHESDEQERDANRFALELLLPGHEDLIAAVRRESRGNYLRFKGAVETVAAQARVGVGLLGMVAAFELADIGAPKDRWGSATNLARAEGPGRPAVVEVARRHLASGSMNALDRMLIDTFVLNGTAAAG